MSWVSVLTGLSPVVAIALIYGWSERNRHKAEEKEEEARLELIRVLASQFVQPLKESLDQNTDAVKKSVEHNERIITNHLSHTDQLFQSVIAEMRARRGCDKD